MQPEIWPRIIVIPTHAQDGNLFRGQNVAEHCKHFEDRLDIEIQGIPHNTVLSLDKETLVTRIASRYISADITNHPTLKLDEAHLSAESGTAQVEILYRIPFTGNASFFTFEPASKSPDPSSKVTINLGNSSQEVTLFYKISKKEYDEQFQEELQKLIKGDVSWVVESLDNVIQHFSEHAQNILKLTNVGLVQRIKEVATIEGAIANIEISESDFENKLSVSDTEGSIGQRNPRYDVFRPLLFGQQLGRCKGSGLEILYSESSVDHVQPKSQGGSDDMENLIVLCIPCNSLKDDRSLEEYLEDIKADPSVCAGYQRTYVETNQ